MMGPLYFVTEPTGPWTVIEQARAAARGGAWAVQLRDKNATDADLLELARALKAELTTHGVKLILNDRVDVAIACAADGLHIGQGDGDPVAIRQRIGPHMILGLSIEAVDQLARVPKGIDYIGAGPVRATATKPDHAPPIGFDGLRVIATRSPVPTFAIGGMGVADVAAVRATGSVGLAVVSAVTRAADPVAATRALVDAWRTA